MTDELEIILRKVTLYNTVGQNKKVIDSGAKNWKELKSELSDLNITFNNMRVIVGGSNVTLESPNAILPETDFLLFLFPVKVKSGFENDDADEDENVGGHYTEEKDPISTVKDYLQTIIDKSKETIQEAQLALTILNGEDLNLPVSTDPEIQSLASEAARIADSLNSED
jgi:hypothetical protein